MPVPSTLSSLFPPSPPFTAKDLPSLTGKVYIITGAASGVGFELAKILYTAGGTVYIAARSTARCDGAIEKIKSQVRGDGKRKMGKLESMVIDLADLRTVRPAVDSFLRKEVRLDVLVHNAGVMLAPKGSQDTLGHDLEMGTNCLAPYLLTLLLEPILVRTAETAPPLGVRIIFVVSWMHGPGGKGPGPAKGMSFEKDGTPKLLTGMDNYMQSKVGGCWLAAEFAKRVGDKGILSVSLHPGLMKTELQRNVPFIGKAIMKTVFKPPIYGAYTELYAGFSPELKAEHNGGYLIAWGRIVDTQEDVAKGLKSESEGGTGAAQKFLEYCSRETKSYV